MKRIDVVITATLNVEDDISIDRLQDMLEDTDAVSIFIQNPFEEDFETDLDNVTIEEI